MRFKVHPIYLGRLFGIPIRAHYSWLPVVPFYTWVIATGMLPREAPKLPVYEYWLLGGATTLLLFASVLAHELAHALMARAEGLGTGSITLHLFGGLAALEGQPAYPSSEFKIAVVGPAASFVLGLVFFALYQLMGSVLGLRAAGLVFGHLGLINWVLAGFNILPGLPLDGGRVLRAVLWRFNKNYREATQIALRAGLTIAVTLVIWGALYCIVFKEWFIGLACIVVGLIVGMMLSTSEGRNRGPWQVKRGTVEDVMNRDAVLVPPTMSIEEFINKVLQNNHHTSFPVVQERRLHGMLLLEELKAVPRENWPNLKVGDCMRPVDASMFMSVSTPLPDARAMLHRNRVSRAVILDSNGLMVGYVSLSDLGKASSGDEKLGREQSGN